MVGKINTEKNTMGKSALSIVASQQIPVYPKTGGQPAYTRSKHNIQTSAKLASFHTCVADKMRGASGNRSEIRGKFASAASSCRGK